MGLDSTHAIRRDLGKVRDDIASTADAKGQVATREETINEIYAILENAKSSIECSNHMYIYYDKLHDDGRPYKTAMLPGISVRHRRALTQILYVLEGYSSDPGSNASLADDLLAILKEPA